jgi:hypothetical protein
MGVITLMGTLSPHVFEFPMNRNINITDVVGTTLVPLLRGYFGQELLFLIVDI